MKINRVLCNALTKSVNVVEGVDGNDVLLLIHDLEKAFPAVFFMGKVKDGKIFEEYYINMLKIGNMQQDELDKVFYFLRGWFMAKKQKFEIGEVH